MVAALPGWRGREGREKGAAVRGELPEGKNGSIRTEGEASRLRVSIQVLEHAAQSRDGKNRRLRM